MNNNHAWVDMELKHGGTIVTPAAIGAGSADGANIAVEKPLQSFYINGQFDTPSGPGLGWDFTLVWTMGDNGYPKLRWQ